MSCFTLPQKIIRSINKSQAKFWWGKRVDKFCRLIKWDSLCQPGSLGGVGISNLSNMNIALVTKLAWRIISQPSSIFRVIKGKYERGTGWWSTNLNSKQSTPFWKSIKVGLQLKDKTPWSIGDGKSIRMGLDPWCQGCPNYTPRLKPNFQMLGNCSVKSLSFPGKWKNI